MAKFTLSAFGDEISPDLGTQMDVLDEHGIKFIEVRGVNGKSIVQHSPEEARCIREQLQARGFGVSAIGSPIGKIGINDDFGPHLGLFRHTLEIAGILGTRFIRMFSFFIPEGEDPGFYRQEVMRRWREFVKAAEGTGMILLHENEKGIYGDTAERCLDLLEALDSDQVRMTFDPANFVQCNVKTYPEAYSLLRGHISYLHIKDALYSDHSVVPAGMGDGRVGDILSALSDSGYEGFLTLEPHLGSFVGLAGLEKDPKIANMPEGGPRQFAVAANALEKLLSKLDHQVAGG